MRLLLGIALLALASGCGETTDSKAGVDTGVEEDTAIETSIDMGDVGDSGPPPWDGSLGGLLEGTCAANADLGAAFTDGFGRADGVVAALVPPTVECEASHNGTHLTLEVRIAGKIQRLVATMQSKVGDPNMRFAVLDAPLIGGAWSEGWHLGPVVDYVKDLGLHAKDFTPLDMTAVTAKVTQAIDVGDKVSVFGTCEGRPESAHLIHRSTSGPGHDGAIVVRPDSAAPRWLLFHFADQDAQFP